MDIAFTGYSDDLVYVGVWKENAFDQNSKELPGADEYGCYLANGREGPNAEFRVTQPDSTTVRVSAYYLDNGTWAFMPVLEEEDSDIPHHVGFDYKLGARGYSLNLILHDLQEGSKVEKL